MTTSRVMIPTGEQKKKLRHPGLSRLLGQDYYGPSEAILAEVDIKGKSAVKPVIVDQRKTGTIDKAEVFVIVSNKNSLGCLFDCFTDTEDFDPTLVEPSHELYSGRVIDSGANKSIGFGKDKIGR